MKPDLPLRVLVVEDDPAFQQVLRKRLEGEGYEVAVAPDGREGLKRIVEFEPHLVVSDWMMPHVDGLELCQSVKAGLRDEAPYFILITAKGEVSDRLLAIETGADDYLVKPCEHGEILARIRTGTRAVAMTQELRSARQELAHLRTQVTAQDTEIRRLRALSDFPDSRAA